MSVAIKKLKNIARILKSNLISPVEDKKKYISSIKDKIGLEIGGPSTIFEIELPVYKYAKRVDMVNFQNETTWESNLKPGFNNKYHNGKVGVQYIAEASELKEIESDCYEFILSCNSLEHIANPIKALREWWRILIPEGVFILILPNKENNFDHKRSFTSLMHLEDDYEKNVDESDLTHLNEILEKHDLLRDSLAGSFNEFRERSLNNAKNRTLHHHVFSTEVAREMLARSGFNVSINSISKNNIYIKAFKKIQNNWR
jgi:SAM-dependent methyltransferase